MINRVRKDKTFGFILVFCLAFCSVTYELVLGQMLAALNGNTISQYSTVIGLYIANLGFGSLFVASFDRQDSAKELFKVEVMLTFLGGFCPLILLGIKALSLNSPIFLYFMICLVGFLSGMEIPLVSDWLKEQKKSISDTFVLGADYFGTVLGCVIFPFIMLPKLGLFYTAGIMGALNFLIANFLFFKTHKIEKSKVLYLAIAWVVIILSTYYLNHLTSFVTKRAFA